MQSYERLNRRWDLIVIGIIVNACLGTVYSWSVFRAPLEDVLAITAAQSGLPYSVFLGAFAFCMPVGGMLIDRIGPRSTLLMGGILVGAGWVSAGFAGALLPLILTYGIIGGAGVGLAYGVPLAVAGSWFPKRRGFAMGLTLAGFGVSPFVTAPLGELLIVRFGVQPAMSILGAGFIVIIGAFTAAFRRGPEPVSGEDAEAAEVEALPDAPAHGAAPTHAGTPTHAGAHAPGGTNARAAARAATEVPPGAMLRTRNFYGLWICYAIGTLAGLTAIGMTAPFGQEVAGLSAPAAAAAVAAFGVLNGVGRPIFGALHDALGTRRSVVLSFGLIAIAAAASLLAGSTAAVPFFIGFGLFWLMLGGWLAIAPAATTRLFGARNYARNYGIMYTAYGVGALIGGSAFSALYARFGSYSPMFVFILALCAVGVLLSVVLLRPAPSAGAS